jgi:hypothetical protein
VLTFIDASAPSQGVPESFSSYLVSIGNAGNAVGRLAGGILADKFGTSYSSPLAHPRSTSSRLSRATQCHDTGVAYYGRADHRMAVFTRDSRARHGRVDLRRIIWRDDRPPLRTDDGSGRERRRRTPHGHVLHHCFNWLTCGPPDIRRD